MVDCDELRRLISAYDSEAQRHRDEAIQAKAKANAYRELLQRTNGQGQSTKGENVGGQNGHADGGQASGNGTQREDHRGNEHGGTGQ